MPAAAISTSRMVKVKQLVGAQKARLHDRVLLNSYKPIPISTTLATHAHLHLCSSRQLGEPLLGPRGDEFLVKAIRDAVLLDQLGSPGREPRRLLLEELVNLRAQDVILGLREGDKSENERAGLDLCGWTGTC